MKRLAVSQVRDEVVEALKRRAKAHGRSVEAEHRALLETLLAPPDAAAFIVQVRGLRDATRGRTFTPSEDLIREVREER